MAGAFVHKGKKYFFLHIPKTGGTMWSKIFANTGLSRGHASGHATLEKKPEGFSFALVRNPLDRLVSCFVYLRKGGSCRRDAIDARSYNFLQPDFPDWIEMFAKNPEHYLEQQHLTPMTRRIGDKKFLDHIGLFENLIDETQRLNIMFYGKRRGRIPVINKSFGGNFEACYTERTKRIVEEIYKDDIELYKEIFEEQR